MGQPKRKEKSAEAPEAEVRPGEPPSADASKRPEGLSLRGWAVLGAVALALNLPLLHYFLVRGRPEATLTVPHREDFADPATVERNFWSTGGHWRVVNGELLSPGVKNNPLWLKAPLPDNVAVELDARSMSPEGDIKVEIFGDGSDHASGYVFIHGGWNNSLSVIARLDEHGTPLSRLQQDAQRVAIERRLPSAGLVETGVFKRDTRMRVEARPFPVKIGQTYRWRIERRGSLLRWLIDGQPFMEFDDPFPLKGPGHDRFGFSSWEAQLYFDNLKVEPL
ncbi:MAG: hypothetical protein HYZ28_16310 [Myxococcales bacterium]|nr:hypothetical protein [Myxococcales bacterium]